MKTIMDSNCSQKYTGTYGQSSKLPQNPNPQSIHVRAIFTVTPQNTSNRLKKKTLQYLLC